MCRIQFVKLNMKKLQQLMNNLRFREKTYPFMNWKGPASYFTDNAKKEN